MTQIQSLSPKQFFNQDNVKAKFQELLGTRAAGFMTSVLQAVSSNALLAKAEPETIFHAAAVAATLDLPINNNLGFAYIIPFNQKQSDGNYKCQAQFQLGYKGFIQLAQRSGQFQTIGAAPIFEGQLIESNPLTGFVFDFTKKTSDVVIGYAAYFKLLNGFEKTLFMTSDELKKHANKFSQTFKKGFGLWKDDFDSMSQKTVIKLLLSKYAPLSIEMQKAVVSDQSIVKNAEATEFEYVDQVEVLQIDKVSERLHLMIQDAATIPALEKLRPSMKDAPADVLDAFLDKMEVLQTPVKK